MKESYENFIPIVNYINISFQLSTTNERKLWKFHSSCQLHQYFIPVVNYKWKKASYENFIPIVNNIKIYC